MTEALTIPTSFGGKNIRIIEKDGEVWIPCKDLSFAFGLDRTACYQHVNRKRDFFGEDAKDGDKLSQDGDIWINERGFYSLLGSIKAPKGSASETLILQFRKSVPGVLQLHRKKEIVQATESAIIPELKQAKEEAEVCGCEPKVLFAAVYRKHGEVEKANALAPAIVHGEPGWYNPSGLVELCNDPNLTAERLNQYLANYRENGEWKPFQYREGKIWRLTKRGFDHGREYPFNLGNGHSEPRIAWRESVLYASGLKRPIAEGQAALPARAGA